METRFEQLLTELGQEHQRVIRGWQEEHNKIWQQLAVLRPNLQALDKHAVELPQLPQPDLNGRRLSPRPQPPQTEEFTPPLPPALEPCALRSSERRPSASSDRGSASASPAESPRQRRPSITLHAIPDSDCETEDAAAVASPPTPTKAALAASPPTPTRARDSVQSYARDSVHSTDAPPAARRVKIGSVEEIDTLRVPPPRRPSTVESNVRTTPTGRRLSTLSASPAPTSSQELNDRLQKVFCVQEPDAKVVTAPELVTVMDKNKRLTRHGRGGGEYTKERMEDVIRELRTIAARFRGDSPKRSQQQTVISWRSFVELMSIPDLATQAKPEMVQDMFNVHSTLRDPRVQQSGYESFKMRMMNKSTLALTQSRTASEKVVVVVNAVASISIMLSLIILGFSMDVEPEWGGWTVLEFVFAVVFVMEVTVKLIVLSPRIYFTGTNYAWNLGDFFLTIVAVVDCIISASVSYNGSARMSMVLRGLRLSRVARLIKLMHWPLLAELANMISAMVIGVPWLFWVTILLCGVLYICAIILRSTVTDVSQEMFIRCGSGDNFDIDHSEADGCKIAYMYGEEYCGSVLKCMFTVFRCIIGDCNTKGGRPLAAIFSHFYGWKFESFYSLSMVCMIFGMTNIITAMFVDATLSGLKFNDVQRKHAKLHETNYVTRKLNEFVMRVSKTVRELRDADTENRSETWRKSFKKTFLRAGSAKISADDWDREELTLSEQEFTQVLQNAKIRTLLDDLDIELEARQGIFEAFGADADGHLGVAELVSGLMRLRGDLQKSDIVSAQMALQTIGEKLSQFQATNLSNQSRLLTILDKISKQNQPAAALGPGAPALKPT